MVAVNRNRLSKEAAVKLEQRLRACVSRLIDEGVLSARAYPLRQPMIDALLEQLSCLHRDFGRAPAIVQHLWRAAVLNRDCYKCRYCRRTAWRTHREFGATLRFELDHRRAKSRLGTRRDDFKVGNIVTACRSCNVVKGQMTRRHFFKELRSLNAGSGGQYDLAGN